MGGSCVMFLLFKPKLDPFIGPMWCFSAQALSKQLKRCNHVFMKPCDSLTGVNQSELTLVSMATQPCHVTFSFHQQACVSEAVSLPDY